jgi:hypothetical protein
MTGLDNVVLEWFQKLFSSTNVLGCPIGKFTFLSIGGLMAAELYNIKNKHKRGVK